MDVGNAVNESKSEDWFMQPVSKTDIPEQKASDKHDNDDKSEYVKSITSSKDATDTTGPENQTPRNFTIQKTNPDGTKSSTTALMACEFRHNLTSRYLWSPRTPQKIVNYNSGSCTQKENKTCTDSINANIARIENIATVITEVT